MKYDFFGADWQTTTIWIVNLFPSSNTLCFYVFQKPGQIQTGLLATHENRLCFNTTNA